MVEIRLSLLQCPSLTVQGGQSYELALKDAALLAILAIDGPTGRNRLCAWLWPQTEPQQARTNLRQRLLVLRRRAGRDVVVGKDMVKLAPNVLSDHLDTLSVLQMHPFEPTGELLGAMEFSDCEDLEQWLRHARERWRVAHERTLLKLATTLEQQQRFEEAIACARRLVHEAPLHESHHRLLMRLHIQVGDRGAALGAYRRLESLLEKELSVRPSSTTEVFGKEITAGLGTPARVTNSTIS